MGSPPSPESGLDPVAVAADALAPLVRSGSLLLIGDVPGTVELPRLVGVVAERARAAGSSVTVALELPLSAQDAVDTGDATRLRADPFWNRPPDHDDGRSSPAITDLVVGLRAAGVTVIAADGPWVGPGGAIDLSTLHLVEDDRDATMARRILAADPHSATIALLGHDHVCVAARADGSPTAGALLARWEPRLRVVAPVLAGGARFGLAHTGATAGVVPLPADGDPEPGAWWADTAGPDGFHGTVSVGPMTASPG